MSGTVALISNDHSWTYNLRRETIQALLDRGYRVVLILPYGEKVELLKQMGCEYEDVPMFERRGMNPFKELSLIRAYKRILKRIKPDVVLTYTIKPNLYGGMAASKLKIPYIANVTGLGTAADGNGLISIAAKWLYRIGLKKATCVFAQNESNRQYLIENRIIDEKRIQRIPGSGVNLDRFPLTPYPDDTMCRFVFISRILKEKGIEHYLEAAEILGKRYADTEFHVCGFCEDDYDGRLQELANNGTVIYHGMMDNVPAFLMNINCIVHPSYYLEGVSNVLLEAAAIGRPIITTDHEGCRETVDDGISGYLVPVRDTAALVEAMERFIVLPIEAKANMGRQGRKKVEQQFDRKIVVNAYMAEIEKVFCNQQ